MPKYYALLFSFIVIPFIAFSQNIIFEANFENTLITEENENPLNSTGLSFETGIIGSAIYIPADGVLQYPLNENLNQSRGTLSMWVNPDWNPGNTLYRIAVVGNDPRNFEIHVDESSNLTFAANTSQVNGNPIIVAGGDITNWGSGKWHQVVFTWNTNEISIYSDGNLLITQAVGFNLPISNDAELHIGSYFGEDAFTGLIDQVIIYDDVRPAEDIARDYDNQISSISTQGNLMVTDAFDRVINDQQIKLIDWEGFLRNPAYRFNIQGIDSVNFPLTVNLTADHGNVYFNSPSIANQELGPSKTVAINSANESTPFYISYFPDKDYDNENFLLQLSYIDSLNNPRIQQMVFEVVDEDIPEVYSYESVLDFSEDTTALLALPEVQKIVEEAAQDWVYFIDGRGIDSIDLGDAEVYIGRTGNLVSGKKVANQKKYRGLYIFAHGTNQVDPCICSTGYPSDLSFQTRDGSKLAIRSIGGHELNIAGDQGTDGYSYSAGDENWDKEARADNKQDLYDLTKHELGHVIFGSFDYPLHVEAVERGFFTSPEISAYYPQGVIELSSYSPDHFAYVTDPISLGTPFGGNTGDLLPPSRGPITKIDLLIMQSIGYPMRPIRALSPLTGNIENKLAGILNESFTESVLAYGSLPYLNFSIVDGILPDGLTLNPFTGLINGIPTQSGAFPITIKVEEYALVEKSMSLSTTIIINPTASSEADIISATTAGQIGNTWIDPLEQKVTIEIESGIDISNIVVDIEISIGASISPDPNIPLDYSSPVNYLVTAQDGVTTMDWTIEVNQATSSIKDQLQNEITIYPNPISDLLFIKSTNTNRTIQGVSIFDNHGKLVFESNIPAKENQVYQINTNEFINGIYYLNIKQDKGLFIKKVIISN